jgi:hypothetical protein
VALTTHPHLVPGLKKEYSYTSTTLWAFVACCRESFIFTLKWQGVDWTYLAQDWGTWQAFMNIIMNIWVT